MLKTLLKYFVITGLVEGFLNTERNRNKYLFEIDIDEYFVTGFLNGWRTIPCYCINYCLNFLEKINKKV